MRPERNYCTYLANGAVIKNCPQEEIIDKASGGVKNLSEECRTELQNIVDGVRKAENLTMAIKAASQEQSVGISEVGGAISQTEQVTQQNAADAGETASISETLAAQVLSLKDQISRLPQQIGRDADNDIRIDQHQERNDITATAPNPRLLRLIQK